MFKNRGIAVVIVGIFFAVISIANGVLAQSLIEEDDKHFQAVRKMLKGISEEGTVSNEQITWNPIRIDNNILLSQLCLLNLPGNYQNPFNCTQFIMCSSDATVYLWQCPGRGSYDPISDVCVYPGSPSAQCPWRFIWTYPDSQCEILGQRPFWSPLTFPFTPQISCGESTDIYYCSNFQNVGNGNCPPGMGYCKAYLACLPLNKCIEVDTYFNYPVIKN